MDLRPLTPRPAAPRLLVAVAAAVLLSAGFHTHRLTFQSDYPMPTTAPTDLTREAATIEARRLRELAADTAQPAKVQADARAALHNLHMSRNAAAGPSNERYTRLYQTHAGRLPR